VLQCYYVNVCCIYFTLLTSDCDCFASFHVVEITSDLKHAEKARELTRQRQHQHAVAAATALAQNNNASSHGVVATVGGGTGEDTSSASPSGGNTPPLWSPSWWTRY
jgi:hypothetical protein